MDDQSRPTGPTPEQIEEAIMLLWGALHRGSPPPPTSGKPPEPRLADLFPALRKRK